MLETAVRYNLILLISQKIQLPRCDVTRTPVADLDSRGRSSAEENIRIRKKT